MKAKELTINFDGLNEEGLFRLMRDELGFPDFFGMNYDALIDCITEMRQPTAKMSKVFLDEDEVLILNCKSFLKANLDTNNFLDVIQFMNEREINCCGNTQILLNLIP